MRALLLTSGGLIATKIIAAWLSTGNAVAAVWVGSKNPKDILRRNGALRIAAPSWSLAALSEHYDFPVVKNPMLSTSKAASAIRQLDAEVLISAITRQIVPQQILMRFSDRAVNFHPAILPHYRGPNPRTGMILDGKAHVYGGMTLHCLSPEIDKGDIIGTRKVPYDARRGFIYWDVCLARAAHDLVQNELQDYLRGTSRTMVQDAAAGSYRRVRGTETTLSERDSACHIKWLCEQLGGGNWLRYRSANGKKYVIVHFVDRLGPRQFTPEKVGRFTIEFDTADARVRVLRRSAWTRFCRTVKRLVAIAKTSHL